MAKLKCAIPGPGGSLGICAVCGDTFLHEILFGERIDCISSNGFDRDLPVHRKCAETIIKLQGKWEDIRSSFPKGPMFDCFEEEYQADYDSARGDAK